MGLREINLVPAEILSRRCVARHLILWGGWLLASLFLIFGFYFYQDRIVLAKKRSMLTLNDMQKHLGMRIGEIKRIQEELERLDQQQAALQVITQNPSYSRILLKLADIMNEDTWLTQLTVDGSRDKEGNISLILTGFSFSNAQLGNFMNQFSRETTFDAVELKYAKETKMKLSSQPDAEPVRLIQFGIECRIAKG